MADVLADSAFHRIVGQRISTLRKARGITQARLAELVRMDTRTIQRAESGESALSIARMRRVAVALDVDMGELFREVPVPAPVLDGDPSWPRLRALWAQLSPTHRELGLALLEAMLRQGTVVEAAAGRFAADSPAKPTSRPKR